MNIKVITVYHPKHKCFLGSLESAIKPNGNDLCWYVGEGDTSDYGCGMRDKLTQMCDDEDICLFIDADDLPTTELMCLVKEHMKPDVDIVYGDTIHLDKNYKYVPSREFSKKNLLLGTVIPDSGTAVRGKIAKEYYRVPVEIYKDWIWYTLLTNLTDKVVHTHRPHVLKRENTSTRLFRRFNIPIIRKIIRKYYGAKTRKLVRQNIILD